MSTSNAYRFNSSAPERQSDSSAPRRPSPRPRAVLAAFRRSRGGPPSPSHPGRSGHVHACLFLLGLPLPGAVQPHQVRRDQSGRCGIRHLDQRDRVHEPDPGPRCPTPSPPGLPQSPSRRHYRGRHTDKHRSRHRLPPSLVVLRGLLCVDRTPWSAPGHWRDQGHRRVQGQALRRRASVRWLCRRCRL